MAETKALLVLRLEGALQAWGEMSTEHISYEQILAMMDEDTSIPEDQKTAMIQTVLNGRWFSTALDAHYENANLWVD